MTDEAEKARAIEGELAKLKASIEKYSTGKSELTPTALADVTKAVHDLSDHVATPARHIQAIEDTPRVDHTRLGVPAWKRYLARLDQ